MAVKIFTLQENDGNYHQLEAQVNNFLIEFEEKNIPTQITVTNDGVVYVFHPTIENYERIRQIYEQNKQVEDTKRGKAWQ